MILNTNDPYLSYYRHQQAGGGLPSVFRGGAAGSVFRGGAAGTYSSQQQYHQGGNGIGSFLGGLFRSVMPLLKSGASAVGKEALRSGVGFLGDVVSTGDPRTAVNTRLKQFTSGLKRRADDKVERVLRGHGAVCGGGVAVYKKRRVKRVTPQSLANLLRVRTGSSVASKKKKKTKSKRKSSKRTSIAKRHQLRTRIVKRRKQKLQKKRKPINKSQGRKKRRRSVVSRHRDIFN